MTSIAAEGASPPAAEIEAAEIEAAAPLAPPWPRYWARSFDIVLEGLIVGGVFSAAFPAVFDAILQLGDLSNLVLTLGGLPFVLVLDALCQSLVGTTPGKAIAGIRLATVRGEKLALVTALRRNLGVYFQGLVLGLPIVSLFGLVGSYQAVRSGDLTSWDKDLDTRVRLAGGNVYRTLLTAALVLGLALGLTLLDQMAEKAELAAPATAASSDAAKAAADAPLTAEILTAALPSMNKELPKTVDAVTTLRRIGFADDTLVYEYALDNGQTNAELRKAMAPDDFRAGLVRRYCADKFQGQMRTAGLATDYRYLAKDGEPLEAYRLTASDCR